MKIIHFISSLILLISLMFIFITYKEGYKQGYKEAKREIIIKTDTLKVYVRDTIFTIKEIQIKYTKRDTDTIFLERKLFLPYKMPFYLLKKEPFIFKEEKEKFSLNMYFIFNQNSFIPCLSIKIKQYHFLYGYNFLERKHNIGLGLTLFSF